jgi:hypothetical protein
MLNCNSCQRRNRSRVCRAPRGSEYLARASQVTKINIA